MISIRFRKWAEPSDKIVFSKGADGSCAAILAARRDLDHEEGRRPICAQMAQQVTVPLIHHGDVDFDQADMFHQSSDVGIGQNAIFQGLTECAPFGADIDQRGAISA